MNTQQQTLPPRKLAEQKYASARSNLLLMLIFTVINIVLFFAGSGTMMLFSATIPYFSVIFGQAFAEVWEMNLFLTVGIIIAVISLALYLLCWIFSKKHFGWMIGALVFFIMDTLVMGAMYLFVLQDASGILDVLVHVWVLYYLIIGVSNGSKLKHLPEEDAPVIQETIEE